MGQKCPCASGAGGRQIKSQPVAVGPAPQPLRDKFARRGGVGQFARRHVGQRALDRYSRACASRSAGNVLRQPTDRFLHKPRHANRPPVPEHPDRGCRAATAARLWGAEHADSVRRPPNGGWTGHPPGPDAAPRRAPGGSVPDRPSRADTDFLTGIGSLPGRTVSSAGHPRVLPNNNIGSWPDIRCRRGF